MPTVLCAELRLSHGVFFPFPLIHLNREFCPSLLQGVACDMAPHIFVFIFFQKSHRKSSVRHPGSSENRGSLSEGTWQLIVSLGQKKIQ